MFKNAALRLGTSFIMAMVFCGYAAIWHINLNSYVFLLNLADGGALTHPFNDMNAILQAGYCWRQGVNVYLPSACMGGGVYNYSPLLLSILKFISPNYTNFIAVFSDLLFFISFAFLPKPVNRSEFILRTMAGLSGAVVYAVERANLDVLIYLLAFAAICLLSYSLIWRILSYCVFIVLAALKFYPLTLLYFIVKERLAALLWISGAVFVAGFADLFFLGGNTLTALKMIPQSYPFGGSFGSIDLAYGFAIVYVKITTGVTSLTVHMNSRQILLLRVLQVSAVVTAFFKSPYYRELLEKLDALKKNFLVAGAIVITTCFFIAQNVDYREIFLIWTIPGLFLLAKSNDIATKKHFSLLIISIIGLLWEAFFRYGIYLLTHNYLKVSTGEYINFSVWLFRELVWWWVIIQMLAILFAVLKPELRRLFREMKLIVAPRESFHD